MYSPWWWRQKTQDLFHFNLPYILSEILFPSDLTCPIPKIVQRRSKGGRLRRVQWVTESSKRGRHWYGLVSDVKSPPMTISRTRHNRIYYNNVKLLAILITVYSTICRKNKYFPCLSFYISNENLIKCIAKGSGFKVNLVFPMSQYYKVYQSNSD